MKTIHITKGSIINTQNGYLKVYGRGPELIYCEEFEIDENDETVNIGTRALTLSEISHIMKEYDGQNYKVSHYVPIDGGTALALSSYKYFETEAEAIAYKEKKEEALAT